jgi:hypothetical protein
MKAIITSVLILASCGIGHASQSAVVFRNPFVLELRVDKGQFYEQKFNKVPFVDHNEVYLFKDDAFGLNLDIRDNAVHEVSYQPDLGKADVTLKFTQEVDADGTAMMILVLENRTKRVLNISALMTVPGEKSAVKTTLLPLQPGLLGHESWLHPIIQLVLQDIQIGK